jgi:hypothetical protein
VVILTSYQECYQNGSQSKTWNKNIRQEQTKISYFCSKMNEFDELGTLRAKIIWLLEQNETIHILKL